jgi:hypothetical protein
LHLLLQGMMLSKGIDALLVLGWSRWAKRSLVRRLTPRSPGYDQMVLILKECKQIWRFPAGDLTVWLLERKKMTLGILDCDQYDT